MALPRLSMSGWNGHWSIRLQTNQKLSGCASGVRRKFSWGGFKVPKVFFALKSKV